MSRSNSLNLGSKLSQTVRWLARLPEWGVHQGEALRSDARVRTVKEESQGLDRLGAQSGFDPPDGGHTRSRPPVTSVWMGARGADGHPARPSRERAVGRPWVGRLAVRLPCRAWHPVLRLPGPQAIAADGTTTAVTVISDASVTTLHGRGALRSSMKYSITSRTLSAAIRTIATVATVGANASVDSYQVDAQVARTSVAQTKVAGFRPAGFGGPLR